MKYPETTQRQLSVGALSEFLVTCTMVRHLKQINTETKLCVQPFDQVVKGGEKEANASFSSLKRFSKNLLRILRIQKYSINTTSKRFTTKILHGQKL